VISARPSPLSHGHLLVTWRKLFGDVDGNNAAAVLMIAVVTVVNVRGTRQSSDLQNWIHAVKRRLVVVLSGVLLVLGKHGGEIIPAAGTTNARHEFVSSFSLAMIAVLWAYEGWQFGTYSAGEVIDPQKVFRAPFFWDR